MDSSKQSSTKNQAARQKKSAEIFQFQEALGNNRSERAAARSSGIARSTARDRNTRKRNMAMALEVQSFFETNAGLKFLHRLVLASEFVITQMAGGGVRLVQLFFQLTQLDDLVASSVGSLKVRIEQLENGIIEYGQAQEEALVQKMEPRTISACLDETFPSDICLVGIEPVSNFILCEEMSEKRDCQSWEAALLPRLENLQVTICQATSDKATALIKLIEQTLEAQHSPDIFHVQQDITKATSAPLNAKVKKAASLVRQLETQLNKHSFEDASEVLLLAQSNYNSAKTHLEDTRDARKSLGLEYHPVDLETGKIKMADEIEEQLKQSFTIIEKQARAAELSENSHSKIAKAKRTIESMKKTIQFFWVSVMLFMDNLALSEAQKSVFKEMLIPIEYLKIQAEKASTAKQKAELKELSGTIQKILTSNTDWQLLSETEQKRLLEQAKECAQLFQRSSSNVEGRNGCLNLQHHLFKQMNPRKLAASTTIHNYFVQRPDNTTAAQRFFGQAHADLFETLIDKMDAPAFSRKRGYSKQKTREAA